MYIQQINNFIDQAIQSFAQKMVIKYFFNYLFIEYKFVHNSIIMREINVVISVCKVFSLLRELKIKTI